ncbi:CLUMA_CG018621, isoform A [Clunio marinus]|uniref:CLUMA_CG018621, isoform A n=1 Tax=Clunio marinus TaxID=568069 RepID=A0A1J1J2H6_9DIPT|nr:CLUMA_CG018621, isoform A [Clunio marinus]
MEREEQAKQDEFSQEEFYMLWIGWSRKMVVAFQISMYSPLSYIAPVDPRPFGRFIDFLHFMAVFRENL